MIEEARMLRQDWRSGSESYVRQYLNHGNWGQDEAWTDLAECVFNMFNGLYLLPNELVQRVTEFYDAEEEKTPPLLARRQVVPAGHHLTDDGQVRLAGDDRRVHVDPETGQEDCWEDCWLA